MASTATEEQFAEQNSSPDDVVDGSMSNNAGSSLAQDTNFEGATLSVNSSDSMNSSSSNIPQQVVNSSVGSDNITEMMTISGSNENCSIYGAKYNCKYPQYADDQSRSATFDFELCSGNFKQHREELIRNGFFYKGDSDCVLCFYCGGCLRDWKTVESAAFVHACLFPECDFIQEQTGPDFVDELQKLRSNNEMISLEQVEVYFRNKGWELPPSVKSSEDSSNIQNNAAVLAFVSQGYDKKAVISTAKDLLEQGKSLCIDSLLLKLLGTTTDQVRDSEDKNLERCRMLEAENDKLRKLLNCRICKILPIGKVFFPCQHFIACFKCAIACNECPLCERHIDAQVKAQVAPLA